MDVAAYCFIPGWLKYLLQPYSAQGCHTLQKDAIDAKQEQQKADEASAAPAAEELIAEEAHEAAQAAAKKAKKKQAKARKQQARSNATSASASPPEASAGASLHAQQDVCPKATLEQSSSSGSRGPEMPPAAGLQMQLQHTTVHDCAMPNLHAPAAWMSKY